MKWLMIRISTTTDAEDIMVSDMCDIGLDGAQIEDHIPLTAREKEQMFVDILPDGPAEAAGRSGRNPRVHRGASQQH